ncbi:MAG: SGNH/GDSL hydrolase family protein [Xanthomonadales bacterium]|nr:SGNH/GDSL hydrolase family protein [Xanthomonadales bacterium]
MWRSTLFWSALPIYATQGLWVRRRALRMPEASGPDTGHASSAQDAAGPLQFLALGDSIIAGVGVDRAEESLPVRLAHELAMRCARPVRWQRRGRNGADSTELVAQWDAAEAAGARPDLVLVSIGVNDATGFSRLDRFVDALDTLRMRLHAQRPNARLLVGAVPPLASFPLLPDPLRRLLGLRADQLNRRSAAWAARDERIWRSDMPFELGPERFAEDGFHPDAAACAEWAAYLAERTVARWPELAADVSAKQAEAGPVDPNC